MNDEPDAIDVAMALRFRKLNELEVHYVEQAAVMENIDPMSYLLATMRANSFRSQADSCFAAMNPQMRQIVLRQ